MSEKKEYKEALQALTIQRITVASSSSHTSFIVRALHRLAGRQGWFERRPKIQLIKLLPKFPLFFHSLNFMVFL